MMRISKEPQLEQRSGTWGLRNATWTQIGKAMELLGGRFLRAGSNGHLIYEVNGTSITTPNASKGSQETGRSALADQIRRIGEAGIPPALFVATLGLLGAGWIKQPADLRELERLARQNQTLLAYEKGREKLIETAEENLRRRGIEKKEDAEVPEPEKREYTQGLTDAIRLGLGSGIDRLVLGRFQQRLSKQLQRNYDVGKMLLDGQHIKKSGTGQGRGGGSWRLTDDGAMIVAHYVETQAKKEGLLPQESKPVEVATPAPQPEQGPKRDFAEQSRPERKTVYPAKPHITLDTSAITIAIIEYLAKRNFEPGPHIDFDGVVSPRGLSAKVEVHWKEEE